MNRITKIVVSYLIGVVQLCHGQFAEVRVNSGNEQGKVNLNGAWFFKPAFNSRDSGLKKADNSWKEISVPGEWLMQGFEVEPGEQAGYFREFSVPADWKNSTVYLRCDAVFSAANIWINGREAGIHTGPMVAFEKEVTGLLKFGEVNRIVMGIVSETMADTLMSGTQYAAHQLGGILRKIYLHAVPKVHLTDLVVETNFDEHYENAVLRIFGLLKNDGGSEEASISVSLNDPSGNSVPLNDNHATVLFEGKNEIGIDFSLNVSDPLKWDAEHPNLYKLELLVASEQGSVIVQKDVGFREIEVVGNQLFINGRAVKLKGVNRHEAHPLLGRGLTAELWEQDAKLYKAANINYIRTSHYPPSEEFIEWCDRLGLYVELENPVSWIGHHANAHWTNHDPHNPGLYSYLEEISSANVSFFRNHPCIIIWSMANESAWGPNWSRLGKFYTAKDPTRPVTFHDQAYGGFNNYGSIAMPVANIHYPGTQGPEIAENFPRPLLFGEYAHLNTYNRSEIVTDPGVRDAWGRGLKKMWENMYLSRGCLGGAIWSGIDDVFYLPEGRAVGYGEWGPIDGWRREKPEYYHIKKCYTPVKIHTSNLRVPPSGEGIELQVENRFDFTNLNECEIHWELAGESGSTIMDLAPHQFGILKIHPKTRPEPGQRMKVIITSPQGMEVETSVVEIGQIGPDNYPFSHAKAGNLQVVEKEGKVEITGPNFSWEFDVANGKLIGAYVNRDRVLDDGAEFMLLSLTTGECLTEHSLSIPFHNSTCSHWRAENTSWKDQNDTVRISVEGKYSEAEGTILYSFTGDGMLEVKYAMHSKIDVSPRQWGIVLSSPNSLRNLGWSRKGLWGYYPENHIGRTSGHATPFQNGDTGIAFGQEPDHDWRFDANELGSNDFRATRENIYWATLTKDNGSGIAVVSNGKQAFRSFVEGDRIRFLVADYSTGGGEAFFQRHYSDERISIEKGDEVKGSVKIRLIESKKIP